VTNIYTIHLVEIFRDCNFTGHEAKAFSSLLALLFIERNANALYVINDIGVTDIGKNGEVNGVREKRLSRSSMIVLSILNVSASP